MYKVSKIDIVRAWKDEGYRNSLSEEERRSLPENPVGEVELSDSDLEAVYGGQTAVAGCSVACNSVVCVVNTVICNSGVCNSVACDSVAVCQSAIC